MLKKLGSGLLIAAGILVGSPAIAQETPRASAPGPQASTPAQPQEGCPCGMMGGGGMQGGMMGHGMGGAGMSCPMAGMADVEVEQTSTGAILRLTAKSPDQVAKVQQHARMMERCMGGGQKAGSSSPQEEQ